MKTLLVILLFACSVNSVKATNYYFSTLSGNDSRTAAEAQNPSTPWKTLNKLNSFFTSLKPGDSALLKRGEIFPGSLNISKSGTSGSPIVIGAFGTGNKPVITSLKTLSSWTSVGNGIYESYNSDLGTSLNVVLLNGVQQRLGRYPNADAPLGGYLYLESHSGTTSITDKQLTSATNWTGAEIAVRQRRWKIDRATITKHSGTTITHTGTTGEPYDGYGYFIQKHIKTLDQFGEWYYNTSTKKLSIYFGSKSPSSYVIEAATGTDLVFTDKASYIVFDNLNIRGANEWSFEINGGSNNYLKNCNLQFAGKGGIASNTHPYLKIEYCTVSDINNNSVNLGYADHAVVRYNKILNTSVLAGMGSSGEAAGIGIITNGDNNIIEYNEIRKTGYNAISLLNGNNVTIKNNFIDSFCLIKDDGGGIYSYGSSSETRTGIKVTGNIIMNGVGAGYGSSDMEKTSAEGLYLDGNASGMEISNNTITRTNRGIYLHSTRYITIKNNTIYNNTIQLILKEKQALGSLRNTVVTNNILFSKTPNQLALSFISYTDDINSFGKFDSNYYARPINDRLVISTSYENKAGTVSQSMDLECWQDKYKKDLHSKRSPKQIAPYKLTRLVGSNRITNGSLATISGLQTGSCTISLSTSGILDGSFLQISPASRNSTVYTKVGSVTAGKKYILRYSVRGSVDSSMAIKTFLRQTNSPYSIFAPAQSRRVGITRSENEVIFIPTSSQSAASVVFQVDDKNKYYLDNIEFYEAEATITDIEDSLRFEYNATNASKSIALNGTYIDMRNKSYSNSIVLQPYTSVILIKTGNGPANLRPTISITDPLNNARFTTPVNTEITAVATDPDGTISKVEFYNGNDLLITENKAPYNYPLKNLLPGTYTITAKAYDNKSLSTTSTPITINIAAPNASPTVNIVSPENNATFNAPVNTEITAIAADTDGRISKVEFYSDTILLTTKYSAPYTCPLQNLPAGNYSIIAKAYDDSSLATVSAPLSISIVPTSGAPIVSLVTPANSASFALGTTITLKATASSPNGKISKVEFYNGTSLLRTEKYLPYSWDWKDVPLGNYVITAKATDNSGNVTTSLGININVDAPALPLSKATTANSKSSGTIANTKKSSSLEKDTKSDDKPLAPPSQVTQMEFKLFPNPANNIIQLNFGNLQSYQKVNVSIIDMAGNIVKSMSVMPFTTSAKLDISSLSAGAYIMRVSNDNLITHKKFLKINSF